MAHGERFDPANYGAAAPYLSSLIDALRGASCAVDAYGGESAEKIAEVRLRLNAGPSYYVQAPVTRAGWHRQWRFKQFGDKDWSQCDTMEQAVDGLLVRSDAAVFARESRAVHSKAPRSGSTATENDAKELVLSTTSGTNDAPLAGSPYREKLAHFWWDCVQVSRRDVFGVVDDNYAPKHLPADANTMFAGYVGANYEPGVGIVLLAVNPGGGGDAYATRTLADEEFYPLLAEFKAADRPRVVESFERINAAFPFILEGWNLQRILRPTLEAAGVTIEEVAFMNIVPYRTRNDRPPPVAAASAAWQRIVDPCLSILAPCSVVAMGKKAGNLVDRLYYGKEPVYCVPRTNGDRYVSDVARQVHEKMRRELRQRE